MAKELDRYNWELLLAHAALLQAKVPSADVWPSRCSILRPTDDRSSGDPGTALPPIGLYEGVPWCRMPDIYSG